MMRGHKSLRSEGLTPEVRVLFWGVLGLALIIGLVLFFLPAETAVYGPWVFLSPRSALLISAAYIGAASYYILVLRYNDWTQTEGGMGGLVVYSLVLIAAMMLHWDKFRPYHPATILYFIFYYAGVFLVPIFTRLQNERLGAPARDRAADQVGVGAVGEAEGEIVKATRIAPGWRAWLLARGVVYLLLALLGFVFAEWLSSVWPWPVLPLELRVFMGQLAILGWGAAVIIIYGPVWRGVRLGLILGGGFGLVPLPSLLIGPTPYNWASPVAIMLPLIFAEWLLTPLVLLYLYRRNKPIS